MDHAFELKAAISAALAALTAFWGWFGWLTILISNSFPSSTKY